jgi:hypothetical protein
LRAVYAVFGTLVVAGTVALFVLDPSPLLGAVLVVYAAIGAADVAEKRRRRRRSARTR